MTTNWAHQVEGTKSLTVTGPTTVTGNFGEWTKHNITFGFKSGMKLNDKVTVKSQNPWGEEGATFNSSVQYDGSTTQAVHLNGYNQTEAVLTVTPNSGSPTYKWYKDDSETHIATGSTYTITSENLTKDMKILVEEYYSPTTFELTVTTGTSSTKYVNTVTVTGANRTIYTPTEETTEYNKYSISENDNTVTVYVKMAQGYYFNGWST